MARYRSRRARDLRWLRLRAKTRRALHGQRAGHRRVEPAQASPTSFFPAGSEANEEDRSSFSEGIEVFQDHWVEFVTVLLLAAASLGAAWGGYQAARWGGVQASSYARAGAARVESTRSDSKAQLLAITDFSIITQCSDTFDTEKEVVQAFAANQPSDALRSTMEACYADRFSPALQTAMDAAWFQEKPVYVVAEPMKEAQEFRSTTSPRDGSIKVEELIQLEHVKSELLEGEARRLYSEGAAANQQSDDYVLTTVFLAMVLFFGGISTKLKWFPVRIGFVGFAGLLLVLALSRIATFPVQ